jgi:hypothetical protein
MNKQTENRILGLIVALFGVYITVRAFRLPITVDEASTAINHVPRLVVDTLFYEREANPNNHILNTLLIKMMTGIFGWHHFIVRLPVLMGAALYAWAALQLSKRMANGTMLRIFALLMFFGNPYLLEFFSFARGYGLAAGLLAAAVEMACRFFDTQDPRQLRNSFVFAGLAVYANFTLLIFWAPFVFLLLLAVFSENWNLKSAWGKSKPALVVLLIFAALWFAPLKRLSRDSEIVNWNELGTWFESVQRIVRASIHANAYLGNGSDLALTRILIAGVLAITGIALFRLVKRSFRLQDDPRIFMALLLPLAALANIAQVRLTHTPYLEARLGLFYWPLVAISLSCAASWLHERYGRKVAVAFVLPLSLLWTVNIARTVNLGKSLEWYHDTDTFTVLEYLKQAYLEEGRTEPYVIDTEWFMQNSFIFHLEKDTYGYAKYAKLPPFHGNQPPMKDADYYYAISGDRTQEALVYYDIVLRIPESSLVLCRRKK